jgi:hypothetical protein
MVKFYFFKFYFKNVWLFGGISVWSGRCQISFLNFRAYGSPVLIHVMRTTELRNHELF